MSSIKLHDIFSFPEKFWNEFQELFPTDLINNLIHLHRKFNPRRIQLLSDRKERQIHYDKGELPTFLPQTSQAVSGNWKVKPIPPELLCRRVEITGPVNSAKMVINMLTRNSDGDRADMAMLDFEDSLKPSLNNILQGYKNVVGAVSGDLTAYSGDKMYEIDRGDKAYVMVRCRGLHLFESNIKIQGVEISAGLLDLAVCFFHTHKIYLSQNLTPKYYIPKCEHYMEARWWNDLFTELEKLAGYEDPFLRATFLIETLPAAFQVEEILFEIKDHVAGLNVGRWDKIFSDIKVLKNHFDRIMADRSAIDMSMSWMENYAKRVIKICHDRGAFAIGGMAAFTPGKTEELRQVQSQKVLKDKMREADWGHDGCWVSHPYFIGIALKAMNFKNQLERKIDFDKYSDILPTNEGPHTINGLRTNIRVGIAYMQGWQNDIGCVSFDNLMEDLATLEISRAQIFQWLHHKLKLDDGTIVTKELIAKIFDEEFQKIIEEKEIPIDGLENAKNSALEIYTKDELSDFLTMSSELIDEE